MRAGGAAAPEHDGEDVRDLEQQASERPVRVLRKRLEQPTAAEVKEHVISGHEPYRSWCRACVAGRGRADAHVGRPGVENCVPIIGVDYGYLWSRAPEASDAPHDEVAGEDPPDGVRTSSPVLCGRCSGIGGYLVIFVSQKGTTSGIVPWLAKELQAGGYTRVVVRSDGEPALLAHVRAARAMTKVSDVPLESVHEQGSKEQSPGNGLAKGAVKELKAKIRTLRHSTEMGLGRRIPETHDSSAWLVSHAAATINWFRPGLDEKTPYELRVGRKFRRPVVLSGQKVWCMSAKKHVSRISAESRWQEGIFLGILGSGVGAIDYAFGTLDGVQPARAIKMVPEIDAWDIELLLAVKGLPRHRRRADPAARIRLPAPEVPPEHVLPPSVGEPAGPDRDESTSDVVWKFASTAWR